MVQLQSFAEMFGTKAGRGQKRSFILCNTFSRSPDEPNRFRAILFLKTPARSIAEHQAVFDGFPIKEMGIDMTCRRWQSIFLYSLHEPGASGYAFFETVDPVIEGLQLRLFDFHQCQIK